MSNGIQFDEDKFNYSSRPQPTMNSPEPARKGGMVGWLMSKGLAKNPSSAQFILLLVVIVNVVVCMYLLFF